MSRNKFHFVQNSVLFFVRLKTFQSPHECRERQLSLRHGCFSSPPCISYHRVSTAPKPNSFTAVTVSAFAIDGNLHCRLASTFAPQLDLAARYLYTIHTYYLALRMRGYIPILFSCIHLLILDSELLFSQFN